MKGPAGHAKACACAECVRRDFHVPPVQPVTGEAALVELRNTVLVPAFGACTALPGASAVAAFGIMNAAAGARPATPSP